MSLKSSAFLNLPKEAQEKYLTLEDISNGGLSNYEVILFAKKHEYCETTQNICKSFLVKTKDGIEATKKNIKKYQIDIDTPFLENSQKYTVFSDKIKCNFVIYFDSMFFPLQK